LKCINFLICFHEINHKLPLYLALVALLAELSKVKAVNTEILEKLLWRILEPLLTKNRSTYDIKEATSVLNLR